MDYQIKNNILSVKISSRGAELKSIQKEGHEYLWEGNPVYWEDRSPLLFPYVGRFTKGCYRFKGQLYKMDIHGFARTKEFEVMEQSPEHITFRLRDDEETRCMYPFSFSLLVCYAIEQNRVIMRWEVENCSEEMMYFGIGGHPGFKVPLEEGLDFEDYYLEFGHCHTPDRVLHTEECFLNGVNTAFHMEDERKLSLTREMFDEDAVVLQNVSDTVTLRTDKGHRCVALYYPKFPYLGLWQKPKAEAPYLCIEPWTSLPSRQDIIEDIQLKHDLIRLPKDESYVNEWWISVD